MITRCDHCGSIFEVSAELVNSSDPGVRCGECLSLFDARANLFNEAEYRQTTATLKPVQKRKPLVSGAETFDADLLETADTVAVEHIYTSAGVKNRAHSSEQGFSEPGFNADRSYSDVTPADVGNRYQNRGYEPERDSLPDYQTGYQSENRSAYRPEQPSAYGADREYPTDIEFERTLATESVLPDRTPISDRIDSQLDSDHGSNAKDSIYRDARKPTRPDSSDPVGSLKLSDSELADGLIDSEGPNHKRQKLRDQEQRALQIEPDRDFSELSSVDIALDQSRLDERREEDLLRRDASQRSSVDDRDFARDTRVVNLGDAHFTPDDVLNRPAVIRDNGRRADEAIRPKPDTPEFDISLDDSQHTGEFSSLRQSGQFVPERIDSQSLSAESELVQSVEQRSIEERITDPVTRDREAFYQNDNLRTNNRSTKRINELEGDVAPVYSESGSGVKSELRSTRNRTAVANLDDRNASEQPSVHESSAQETSAQEMRRYQHYRPSVDVEHLDDFEQIEEVEHREDVVLEESLSRAVTQKRSSAGALFWMAGLVLAIGLLLFAARGLIANMNLPEPVITAFCKVTGCVPDQAKKNVDQLQTMRKRLYPHPEIENAIVISVDVVNNSIYKQPLPTLAVSLLDEDDQPVAERDFASVDYEVVDGSETGFLMPDEPTRIKIEVINTGLAAADVELAFK